MKDGEKPSRYFCNLMKKNVSQRYISKLVDDNGIVTKSQAEVEKEFVNSIGTYMITKIMNSMMNQLMTSL